MHELIMPIKYGLIKGLNILWLFTKIVIPITLVVVFLNQFGAIENIAVFFAPFMGVIGLSGEAAIPLFLGFFVGIYAAVGAILTIGLDAREITILAAMILISHSLLVESAICKQVGLGWATSLTLRIATSLVVGIIYNQIYFLFGVI